MLKNKNCNNCEFLDVEPNRLSSKNIMGGMSFSCKKGYYNCTPYPLQPIECEKDLPLKKKFVCLGEIRDE